jgi:hypothetical protein
LKLLQEWGERIKENDGEGEFNYDIFDYGKNFCKLHNVTPPSTKIKKEINK